jgi:hypothetical protein
MYLTVNYDLQQFQLAPAIIGDVVTPDLVSFYSPSANSCPASARNGSYTGAIVVGWTLTIIPTILCLYSFKRRHIAKKLGTTIVENLAEESRLIENMEEEDIYTDRQTRAHRAPTGLQISVIGQHYLLLHSHVSDFLRFIQHILFPAGQSCGKLLPSDNIRVKWKCVCATSS